MRTSRRRLPPVGVVLTGTPPLTSGFIRTQRARRCARCILPNGITWPSRVTNDVGAFLRNHANGRAQGTNEGSVSSTHCVSPLLLQTPRDTKLLPVVQLRSGVILLMGDPDHLRHPSCWNVRTDPSLPSYPIFRRSHPHSSQIGGTKAAPRRCTLLA
jgi:hypothetical protein